jgi:hypothetical protein
MQITRGKLNKPQKVVIYGPEGVGKSTFASQFPDPLFIDTEDSTASMDVTRFPRPTSWTMLYFQIDYVKKNPEICKTLVVDTADWAESLCAEHICARGNVKGIADFGYGNGYVYLEEEFGRFLNKLQEIIEVGINVVVTAHAEIKKIEQPEEIGGFDHWQLKLEKKTAPLLKEWSDILLFANYKVYVVNVDNQGTAKGKNKAQGGKRVMYTTHTPWWDAKNRHELPDELPFEYKVIAHCIPEKVVSQQPPKATPAPEQQTTQTVAVQKEEPPKQVIEQPEEEPPKYEPPKPEPPKREPVKPQDLQGIPKPLADLMLANDVTPEEIQQAVASRGYYPKNTPIEKYDPNFINGVLVGAWAQVFQMILDFRNDVPF